MTAWSASPRRATWGGGRRARPSWRSSTTTASRTPGWLEAALAVAAANPGALFQGRVEPHPDQLHLLGPFARTVQVVSPMPYYNVNVFYPRELLERLGGLDEEAYTVSLGGGEDTDLGWRAIEAGTPTTFAPEARIYHPVQHLGPLGKLRVASRWQTIPLTYARHPGLRRADLDYGIFWKNHYILVRALVALALPRRVGPVPLGPLRSWLGWPYLGHLSSGSGRSRPPRCTSPTSCSTT